MLLNGGFLFISGVHNQHQSVIEYHCNKPFYNFLDAINGEIFIYSTPKCNLKAH